MTRRLRVLVVGLSTQPVCAVRAYADVLDDLLEQAGTDVEVVWPDRPDSSAADLRAVLGQVRAQCAAAPVDVVLLHYSVFAFSRRGVPLQVPAFARGLRRDGVPVVVLAHEVAFPWGRRGWRGWVHAVTQRVALVPLVAMSSSLVVTTAARAAWLGSRWWLPGRPSVVAPVFSTIDPVEAGPTVAGRVGVFGFAAAGLDVHTSVEAVVRAAGHDPRVHLVLIGAPGPEGAAVDEWRAAAVERGCPIEFTGVGTAEEVSRQLLACEVVLFPDEAGPSSRKTSLAAALAHARPVVAFPLQEPWPDLLAADAVRVVPRDADAVAAALVALVDDPDTRATLGAAARRFSQDHLTPDRAAALIGGALADAARVEDAPG